MSRRGGMWLAKPVYEALPFYYALVGIVALAARPYVNYGYWPVVCTTAGALCLLAAVAVWLMRRSHRGGAQ